MVTDIIEAVKDLHVIHHISVYSTVCNKKIILKPVSIPGNLTIVTISDNTNYDRYNLLHKNIPQDSIKHIICLLYTSPSPRDRG